MAILACGCTGRRCRCAPPTPPTPVVADPAEPVSLETVPVDPDGESFALVLGRLPAGVRIRVEATSTDATAVRWLHDLGVAALVLATRYEEAAAAGATR